MQNSFFKSLIKFIFTIILIVIGIYFFLQKMNVTNQNQTKTEQILQKLWNPKKPLPEPLQNVLNKNSVVQENKFASHESASEKSKEKVEKQPLTAQVQDTKNNLQNETALKSLQEENKELKIQMQNLQNELKNNNNVQNETALKSLQEENKELKIQMQNLQNELNEIKQNQTLWMHTKDIESKQTQNYINNLTNSYNQLHKQLLTLQTSIEQNKTISFSEQKPIPNTEVNEPMQPVVISNTPKTSKSNENIVLQSLIVLDDHMNNIHIHGQLNLSNSAHIWCLKNRTEEKIQIQYNLDEVCIATSNSLQSAFQPMQTPILESTQMYVKIYQKNIADSISNTYDLYLKSSSTDLDEIVIQSFEEN